MRVLTNIKLSDQKNKLQPQPGGGIEDFLPGALGIAGGMAGHVLGVPLGDIETGSPLGSMALGAGLSGLGGGVGEAIRQVFRSTQGKGFDTGQILKSGGEQAAYGAIPGGEELKALKNVPQITRFVGPIAEKGLSGIAARTAARTGTGYLGGATAQGIENIGSQKPQDQNSTGVVTGAINALMPGVTNTLGIPGGIVRGLGTIAKNSAERAIERKNIPAINAIQRLFGKEAIITGGGKSSVSPDVQSLIDKYNIPLPPKGNISEYKPALDNASKDIENQLKPILSRANTNYSQEIRPLLYNNAETFFGTTSLADVPPQVKRVMLDTANLGTNPNLYDLKNVQRTIGKLVKTSNWSEPKDEVDQFAINTYKDLGELIQNKLDGVKVPEYQNLINQHKILVKARDNYGLLTKTGGVLPTELTSTEHAKEQMGSGLSAARAAELGLRTLPLLVGAGAQFTGLPKELKEAALLGTGLYGAAEFGPAVNPQKALSIAGKMQQAPTFQNPAIVKLLQQLGVRIPGLGGQ